ncbi:hypothetical protein [Glutamicibacter sp. NPDC087344]
MQLKRASLSMTKLQAQMKSRLPATGMRQCMRKKCAASNPRERIEG